MRLFREVGLYEEIPAGFRPVYWNYSRSKVIVTIVGLHWVARFFRRCWERSFYLRPSVMEERLSEVSRLAKQAGYELGRSAAMHDVWVALAKSDRSELVDAIKEALEESSHATNQGSQR